MSSKTALNLYILFYIILKTLNYPPQQKKDLVDGNYADYSNSELLQHFTAVEFLEPLASGSCTTAVQELWG